MRPTNGNEQEIARLHGELLIANEQLEQAIRVAAQLKAQADWWQQRLVVAWKSNGMLDRVVQSYLEEAYEDMAADLARREKKRMRRDRAHRRSGGTA